MNENDLRNNIMKTAKVYEWFGKKGIKESVINE